MWYYSVTVILIDYRALFSSNKLFIGIPTKAILIAVNKVGFLINLNPVTDRHNRRHRQTPGQTAVKQTTDMVVKEQ